MRCASSISSGNSGDGSDNFFHVSYVSVARISSRAIGGVRSPLAWLYFDYISSVKRKACTKLNFPWRDRLLSPVSMQLQPSADGCIAVGGLAIELRLDRCTFVYPLYETASLPCSRSSLWSLTSSAAHK